MAEDLPLNVWIVEDEARYRDALALLIGRASGMSCGGAFGTAEEALRSAASPGEEAAPDAILMDINLPGMDGLTGTSRLKALLPEVPVVMMTIRDDPGTIYGALRAGASGYLLKDTPFDVILSSLRQAAAGGMLMPAAVARKVLDFFQKPELPERNYGLTEREREVLESMIKGLSQKEIAAALFVSMPTVSTHVQHIYRKLHVRSASAAVAKAMRERIV